MARLLLALLLLCGLSAGSLARADERCASDGCGCPHEAPSASCCCAGVAPRTARAPALDPQVLLDELRSGPRPDGPFLVEGGCRGARRSRALARTGPQPGLAALAPSLPLRTRADRPRARLQLRPEPIELEPTLPPPRRARA